MRSIFFVLLFASTAIVAAAQKTETYAGKLDPKLSVDMVHVYQRVYSSTADISKLKLSPLPEKDAVVSTGDLIDVRKETSKTPILLVEPPTGNPYFWIDVNENGVFEAAEKVPMTAPSSDKDHLTATIML